MGERAVDDERPPGAGGSAGFADVQQYANALDAQEVQFADVNDERFAG
jgi:hypothetical protein